jgi:pimeloyl-ACP methyl ester carboxylesterase
MPKDAVARYVEAERTYFAREGVAPQERYLDLDRPRLRVRVLDLGAGEPVLFVHGGGGSAAQWAPLLARIRGRRLLAVDRPGCGLTPGFDNRGIDLRAHAIEFLGGVLDGLEIEAVDLVAGSMGATWAIWLALDEPNRVRSLALLGSPALIEGSGAPLPFRLLGVRGLNRVLYAMEPTSDAHGRKTFRRMGHDPATVPEELMLLQSRAEALPTYRTHWLSLMENVFPWARQAVTLTLGELAQVRQPVRFIWGERDPFGQPSLGETACWVMPKARLTTLATGHLPWVDEPAQCGDIVQELLDRAMGSPVPTAIA